MKEYEYHNKIMGCDLDISIITDTGNPQKYFDICFKELQKYESIFSRFDDKSELSLLNKNKKIKASHLFFEVFSEAEKLYFQSNTLFNPLTQVEQFGYRSDFSNKDFFKKLNNIDYNDDFSKIIVEKKKQTICLQDNQKLDFGGFLKGYCAEKISEKLSQFHGSIINIGGDIYAQGYDEDNKKLNFSIYHPLYNKDILDISLKNQALSTSGIYKRFWQSDTEKISHIIDSKKKESTKSDIISASIISNNGAQSDAWATLAVVLGSEKAQQFFNNKNVNYIFITKKSKIIHNLATVL